MVDELVMIFHCFRIFLRRTCPLPRFFLCSTIYYLLLSLAYKRIHFGATLRSPAGDLSISIIMSPPSSSSPNPPLDENSQTDLKLLFLYDIKNRKVVLAEAGADFVDMLFGFLGFPITSLGKVKAGAMTRICESLASLGGEAIQPGFNNTDFFDMKPTFEGQHNRLITFLKRESPSSGSLARDDFKETPLFTCGTCTFDSDLFPYYVTTDPKTLCGTCRKGMKKELLYADARDVGGIARSSLKFLIFDNMEMKPARDCLETFDLVKKMGFNWANLKPKELALTVKMVCALFILYKQFTSVFF